MQSSSVIVLLLVSVVVCLLSVSSVSADGSIQPFVDQYCDNPTANATLIPIVSSPECQWVTINDVALSFRYECFAYSNMSMAFWYNTTEYCLGQPDVSVATVESSSACTVATYDDPEDHVLFYAQFSCYADWSTPQKHSGAEGVKRLAGRSAQEANIVPQLSALLPALKNTALERMVRQIEQLKDQ